MTKRTPYTFPHRSRKAKIEYLAAHEFYHPMNSWNGGFCLSWNVKIYTSDFSGTKGDYPVNRALDAAWEKYVESDQALFWMVCEDVFRSMAEDYSTYPGDDQGQYAFALNGRSGGHLILTECKIVPQPRAWRLFPMIWASRADYHDWLEELSADDLTRFYKAVRCMDHDFARPRVEAEFHYQLNFHRSLWEEGEEEEAQRQARKLEALRPDMYAEAC